MGRYYEDELIHYGVKGMKWGVRRYQPYPDGKSGKFLGKKKNKQKKSLKAVRADRAREDLELGKKLAKKYVNALEKKAKKREAQARAEEERPGQSYVRDRLQLTTDMIGGRVRGIKKSDRVIDKISYAIGNKGAASDQRATSNFNARRAKRARTTLGKAWRTSKSKNNAEMAKYHDAVAKQDIAKRLQRGLFFDDTYFNTTHHRMSGRKTTKGRVMVDRYLTGGTVGAVKDVAYIAKKKQKTNGKKK